MAAIGGKEDTCVGSHRFWNDKAQRFRDGFLLHKVSWLQKLVLGENLKYLQWNVRIPHAWHISNKRKNPFGEYLTFGI